MPSKILYCDFGAFNIVSEENYSVKDILDKVKI